MKFDRLPTRRKPIPKTLYARLFNKAKPTRQRAAAAAHASDDTGDSGINISRSLTIIFAIHIVAIGMIFIHKQYLSGRTTLPESMVASTEKAEPTQAAAKVASASTAARSKELRTLSNGDGAYIVRAGETFPSIAAERQVDESELRNINVGKVLRPGVVLRIPKSQRIIAEDPPEVVAIRNQSVMSDSERGLVEILPPVESDASAQVIRPTLKQLEQAPRAIAVSASGRTHTVKSGENIWRISNQYKVDQKALMSLNKISDPTKLKIGQTLQLP